MWSKVLRELRHEPQGLFLSCKMLLGSREDMLKIILAWDKIVGATCRDMSIVGLGSGRPGARGGVSTATLRGSLDDGRGGGECLA